MAFVLILLTFFVWYRARRKTSGGLLAFCMPKRKSDSYYRELRSPSRGGVWDSQAVEEASERKPSMQSRSETMTPVAPSPPPVVKPVMTPAPARLNSTFIGRERNNNLVRASLNRHQLSTLDEYSSYEYESEQLAYPTPPTPASRSLAQQISVSAQRPPSSDAPPYSPAAGSPFDGAGPGGVAASSSQLDGSQTIAPLQPRKLEGPRPITGSSWVTASQPGTPLQGPPPESFPFPAAVGSEPRFRSVDHWTDYQNRMAQRDRSMTSGEYSQAFRDRDSTADSLNKRDSTSTIAVFRYHPGEEVQWGAGVGGGRGAADPQASVTPNSTNPPPLPLPSSSTSASTSSVPAADMMPPTTPTDAIYRAYQPYQPPRRMHSAKNARGALRYNYGGPVPDNPSPPSPPEEGGDSGSGGGTIVIGQNVSHQRQESEATVFKYHPGEEVLIDRADKIRSEDLDAWFAPQTRTISR